MHDYLHTLINYEVTGQEAWCQEGRVQEASKEGCQEDWCQEVVSLLPVKQIQRAFLKADIKVILEIMSQKLGFYNECLGPLRPSNKN